MKECLLDPAVIYSICSSYDEIHEVHPATDELYFLTYTKDGIHREKQQVAMRTYYHMYMTVRIHVRDRDKVKTSVEPAVLEETFGKGGKIYFEYRRLDNGGQYRWCFCELVAVDWDDPQNRRVFCLLKDIHRTRKNEENQKQKLIDAFMASERSHMKKIELRAKMSHDGRTNLNGILGIASLLKDRLQKDTEEYRQAVKIYDLAQNMFEVVKEAEVSSDLVTKEYDVATQGLPNYKFGNETILLAEDNEVSMEVETTVLQLKGIRVVPALNGKEAVEIFEKSEPDYFDAVLMDINMPEMDGIQATKKIRSLSREDAQSVPIFAISANAQSQNIQTCMENGMDGYFLKPLNMEQLYAVLGRLLWERAEQPIKR